MLPTMEVQGFKLDGFGWFRVSVNANKIGFGCKRLLRHGNSKELGLRVVEFDISSLIRERMLEPSAPRMASGRSSSLWLVSLGTRGEIEACGACAFH